MSEAVQSPDRDSTQGTSSSRRDRFQNRTAFESRYSTVQSDRIVGVYSGNFSNGGERITLVDDWNGVIADLEYDDGQGWPQAADGDGHSLVPLSSAINGQRDSSLSNGSNWRASSYIGGSPGWDDEEL